MLILTYFTNKINFLFNKKCINFERSGFNGKPCILRAICEMAQYKFGNNNGVLGDILHIIFTYAIRILN